MISSLILDERSMATLLASKIIVLSNLLPCAKLLLVIFCLSPSIDKNIFLI